MGEMFEIRSCIEILANDNLKIYTIYQCTIKAWKRGSELPHNFTNGIL